MNAPSRSEIASAVMGALAASRPSLAELTAGAGDPTRRWIWSARETLSLQALLDRARGMADAAGRRVLLASDRQIDVIAGLLGLDGRAACVVLRPPDVAAEAWPQVMATAALDTIIAEDPAPLSAAHVRCSSRSEGDVNSGLFHDTEWLMFTSGSTGEPKMVVHTLAGLIDPIGASPPVGRQPPVWGTFYDIRRYGGLQILLRALLGAGSLVLSDAAEAVGDHLQRLGRHRVTHLSGTPSHWRRALMRPEIAAIAPGYVRLSGEIADQALLDRLRTAFPEARVAHAYASTEAGVGFEVDDGLEGLPARLVDGGGSEHVAMRFVDGSLRLRSRRGALRYAHVGAPALADEDGFIDSGDLLERRGGRLHFVGRREGVINVGGLKIHPEEVEAVIDRHPGVRMSRVKPRRSALLGALVTAELVPVDANLTSEDTKLLCEEVLALCRSELAAHRQPATVTVVAELALTAAGKLDRRGA